MTYQLSNEDLLLLKSNANVCSRNDPFSNQAEVSIAQSLPVIDQLDAALSVRARCTVFEALIAQQREAFILLNGDSLAFDELSLGCGLLQGERTPADVIE